MNKYTYTKEQLETAVKTNFTMADTLRVLNLPVKGFYYNRIKYDLKSFGIDNSHWLGCAHGKTVPRNKKPLSDILVKNSKNLINKKRLINEGVVENKCSICNITEWMGKPLTLHLDHIDGDSFNNTKENLRLVCPNCHSQTETYCKGIRRKNIKKCMDCDRVVRHQVTRCKKCNSARQLVVNSSKYPSIDELVRMVQETSYEEVGRQHKVTGAAIKKFIKRRKGDVIPRYNKRT